MELEELYALMERFARSGLTDLEWEREGEKIALRCAPAPVVVSAPAAAPAAPAPAPVVYPHEVDRYAFDAAVAAAIAAYTGRDIKGFRITRITKM